MKTTWPLKSDGTNIFVLLRNICLDFESGSHKLKGNAGSWACQRYVGFSNVSTKPAISRRPVRQGPWIRKTWGCWGLCDDTFFAFVSFGNCKNECFYFESKHVREYGLVFGVVQNRVWIHKQKRFSEKVVFIVFLQNRHFFATLFLKIYWSFSAPAPARDPLSKYSKIKRTIQTPEIKKKD